MKPIIAVNFKTYKESTGEQGVILARELERASKELQVSVILVVQPTDLYRISKEVSLPVYSEHVDPISYGAHTGSILAESLKENNAVGVLLNHSEDRFRIDKLEESIKRSNKVGLKTMVCATDELAAKTIAAFNPDFVAVEPPELIGGDISVSTSNPKIVSDSVANVKKVNPKIIILCGAGIKTNTDFKKALQLGASGVLIASGIVLAKNPYRKLKELGQI